MKAASILNILKKMPVTATIATNIRQQPLPSPRELFAAPIPGIKQFRILLLKPYNPSLTITYSPPLGLLYLVSALRACFKDAAHIDLVDMKVNHHDTNWLATQLDIYKPDFIGVSALSCEAKAANDIAAVAKRWNPSVITVLGGPYTLHQSELVFSSSLFDWVIEGSGERTLPLALERHLRGEDLGEDLPGFSHRNLHGATFITKVTDVIKELDDVPLPAWDLIDFEQYRKVSSMCHFMTSKRYATIFTSRGCPYLCNYCHDIFSKKFVHRSVENVIAEIELLHEKYGVVEFQVVDDIFNLHKPRVKAIMEEVHRRWKGKLFFNFPNGLRADILDLETINALKLGGTYFAAVAIETVTPRLQTLVEKHLDIDKTWWAINTLEEKGISVGGFFMLGFPTESLEEIENTVRFAINSKITLANFFRVVPQSNTPLYELAYKESPEALKEIVRIELGGGSYHENTTWYELAYHRPLGKLCRQAHWRFYFGNPLRSLKILWRWPKGALLKNIGNILGVLLPIRKLPFLNALMSRKTASSN